MSTPGIVIELQQLRTDNEAMRKEIIRLKHRELKLYQVIFFCKRFVVAKELLAKYNSLMEEVDK